MPRNGKRQLGFDPETILRLASRAGGFVLALDHVHPVTQASCEQLVRAGKVIAHPIRVQGFRHARLELVDKPTAPPTLEEIVSGKRQFG